MTLLFGIGALILFLAALHYFRKANPQNLADTVRKGGGLVAVGAGIFMSVRGNIYAGAPLVLFGLSLLDWLGPASFSARMNRSTGQVSKVRSQFVEMELDHDTGAMTGTILAGQHAGTALDALDVPTLLSLYSGFDPESRALLEAYLDRREPGWRVHVKEDAGAGPGQAPRVGPMTEEEAYQILGLEPGADADAIGRAHRSLMKKLHPDQGGSTYLATRVNQARDVLLRRHN
jgi:DnaJ-domain-containing protein 1